MVWIAALIAVAAVAAALAWTFRPRGRRRPRSASKSSPRRRLSPTSLAVSPDGRQLVFVASAQGQSRLWLRPLNSVTARPLAGTENARFPFWSPDGRSVGFAADDQLKRVDVESGSVRVLASGGALGGTWNRDGVDPVRPACRVAACSWSRPTAASPQPATRTSAKASNHVSSAVPAGPSPLSCSIRRVPSPGIYAGVLGAPEPLRRIVDADAATYAATRTSAVRPRRHAVRAGVRSGAARTSAGSPAVVAERIAERVWDGGAVGIGRRANRLSNRTVARNQHQFVWFDRSGNAVGNGCRLRLRQRLQRLAVARRPSVGDGTCDQDRRHLGARRGARRP